MTRTKNLSYILLELSLLILFDRMIFSLSHIGVHVVLAIYNSHFGSFQ